MTTAYVFGNAVEVTDVGDSLMRLTRAPLQPPSVGR